ncbi:hypothetical protein PTSG_00132 [Salpingoeca rosetta]|uniref:Uncharacterized protein n=1 Tax=Salpingoeca rosetta (strain ATCC 50818 / BSB-021) TaxID=946362 RepID=F2TVL9_SALR5|nr:uncharacterized protein PTSG_00132 [Salpingoeca rosetta]EGD72115.1 hypothetical protein PTSG_00132 [Salpingoeca rosetta]|eukprot:XP_004998687.1 hypothetical protein PTSG_00132 [Salpingoeca rosetta]
MKFLIAAAVLALAVASAQGTPYPECPSDVVDQASCEAKCPTCSFCSFQQFNGQSACHCGELTNNEPTYACEPAYNDDEPMNDSPSYPECPNTILDQASCDAQCPSCFSCFYMDTPAGPTCFCIMSQNDADPEFGCQPVYSMDDDFFGGHDDDIAYSDPCPSSVVDQSSCRAAMCPDGSCEFCEFMPNFGCLCSGNSTEDVSVCSIDAPAVHMNQCPSTISGAGDCYTGCPHCDSCTFVVGRGCACSKNDVLKFTCGDVPESGFGDDDFGGLFPGMDAGAYRTFAIEFLVTQLGAQCRDPLNKALTTDLVKCLTEGEVPDFEFDFEDSASIDTMCGNRCISQFFRGVSILDEAGCLAALPADDDDDLASFFEDDQDDYDDGDDGDLISGIEDVREFMPLAGAVCTKSSSNKQYCGKMVPYLDRALSSPGNVTADDCRAIIGYGACLGTFRAAVTEHPTLFSSDDDDNGIDADNFVAQLESLCRAQNVTGITEAASATEAPSSLASSSATSVSGIVAFVAAAVVAALLA